MASNNITTGDGKAVHGNHRIEGVLTMIECRRQVQARSWQISRLLRRDFNLVSTKMYMRARNKEHRLIIQDLLLEISLQCAELQRECKVYAETGDNDADGSALSVRIVSAESAMFLKALCLADGPIAKLNWAYKQSQISERTRDRTLDNFEYAIADLKRYLFARQPPKETAERNKTAAQLGKEMGIT